MNMQAAKQNQKFPFHFLSAPPAPPAENHKLRKENFWFLLPRPKGADEARIICFESKCELGTIETPEQNLTAFSKPEGGTREARPTDFPPFFQTNLERRLRRRALFSRQEAGAKSEAILTHSICSIQKEFLLL